MLQLHLGVYVGDWDDGERQFLQHLSVQAKRAGFQVGVFTNTDLEMRVRRIQVLVWHEAKQRWIRRRAPFPDVIYNRCLDQTRPAREALSRLLRASRAALLQRPFTGKWRMHQLLRRHPLLRNMVPRSARWRGRAQLMTWLRRAGAVVLKPQSGSGGRGVIRLELGAGGAITARGRDGQNSVFTHTYDDQPRGTALRRCFQLLDQVNGRAPLIIQPFLKLETVDKHPFDVRAFVSRSSSGGWRVLGIAARLGERGGLTSNLAGGGQATNIKDLFQLHLPHLTDVQKQSLIRQILSNGRRIGLLMETRFGRCFEIGIDFAITHEGRLFVLEVNGKPGRTAFIQSKQEHLFTKSVSAVVDAYKQLVRRKRPLK